MPAGPQRKLGLFDCTAIVIGAVVGAGIFETTPAVASATGSGAMLLAVFAFGGLVALAGALSLAELAARYPVDGGDFEYLHRAWGPRMGFMFVWCGFWLVRPANIGAMALIFGRYAQSLVPLGGPAPLLSYALLAVLALTAVNLAGVRASLGAQNLLTVLKVAGLLLIAAVGLTQFGAPPVEVSAPAGEPDPGLALILVLFTYGGWNVIAYVAAEVEQPERNITRGLLLGTASIVAIYLAVNLGYLAALGFNGVAASESVAADIMTGWFGAAGSRLVSAAIALSCLGTIHAMLFTNARLYFALGRRHRVYRWVGQWHARLDCPARALALQGLMTALVLVVIGGNRDAFERLVVFTAPMHWFFFSFTLASLFVFRRRIATPSPYRVPAYPLLPLAALGATLLMLVAALDYALANLHLGLAIIGLVVVSGFIASRSAAAPAP